MKFLLFISVFALALNSCRTTKDATATTDVISIKHGTSYGHCVGYCMKEEFYTSDRMVYTQSSRDAASNPPKEVSESYNDLNKLIDAIDWAKWKSLPETIGCPDCADGGAEFVEITTTTGVKRVTFDAGSSPEGLEKVMETFRKKRASLEKANSGE